MGSGENPAAIRHGRRAVRGVALRWPSFIIEQLKVIGPLTDPTAHGRRAEDAFDVVIPSLPGYGFSGRPTGVGWDQDRIARVWAKLMTLGYTGHLAQGGDWGTPVSSAMARQAAAGSRGIHINLPAAVPPDRGARRRARAGGTVREGRCSTRSGRSARTATFTMAARPQTVGYGATDSPAGLAAWVLVHPGFAQ